YDLAQNDDGNGGLPVKGLMYWDNGDAPTSGTTFLPVSSVLPSTSSATFYWAPLSYAAPNEDFFEYKIHFREQGGQWRTWDGVNDATMQWPLSSLTSPASFAGGLKFTTIPDLKIFTTYEYYMTAVDIFGNESNNGVPPATPVTFKTLPYSIDVTLTDGITHYFNTSFIDLNPAVRQLRETNIKVVLDIVSATDLPEIVRIWFTTGDSTTLPDIVSIGSPSVINSAAFAPGALLSVEAVKTAPNQWTGYIPSTNQIIKAGNPVRFIVETVKNGVSSFSDSFLDTPVSNPNLSEWTFSVVGGVKFTPWPVRVLNNVITKKNPVAYPSYYLSSDALVSLVVFDIRGQQVKTLLDSAFRRGGQNIKENGWDGTNKAGRSCGPGLYYIHFKAKRATDGKVILDEFKKIVIAR
ncbi:MAG TPA: hypothetical protein VF857_02735, partial [Spirochaetota bacterium]